MSEHTGAAAPRRAALAFIFVTVTLDMLALGIVIPVLPRLIAEFLGGDFGRAAEVFGLFGTVWAIAQFVTMPIFGVLSDRVGRRPIILISNFGLGLDYILMALAPSLAWLFVGRVISGITAASITTASAYIADVTAPEKRAGAFGLIGIAFGLGFVLGPAVGGLLGAQDPRLPFWLAAGLSLLNGLYGLFILPESLPKELRSPFKWRRANPVAALAFLRSRAELSGLAIVSFLSNLAHVVLPSTFVLYASHRYAWTERDVGLTLAGVGIASAIVQGGLVRPVVKRLGEQRTLLLGLGFGALGFAAYGAAPSGALFLAGLPFMALWGLTSPALQGLATRRVGADEQGRLQGALSSVMGLAGLFGPALFTQTFALSIDPAVALDRPGAPFYLATLLLIAAAAVAWREIRADALRAKAASVG